MYARVSPPGPWGREEWLSWLAGGRRSRRKGRDPASHGEKEDLGREFLDHHVWPYPMPTGTSSNASAAVSFRLNGAVGRAWKCFD